MKKSWFLLLAVFAVLPSSQALVAQPVLPSETHLKWADSEIGVLIHFDMPVFEPGYNFRKDWNYHPDLSIFNPKELDTDQWIRAAKGERILECKLSGMTNNTWQLLGQGSCIGHKRIEIVRKGKFSAIKLEITKSEGTPSIRSLACYGR